MYRCQICDKIVPSNTRATKLVVATRERVYEARGQDPRERRGARPFRGRRGPRKKKPYDKGYTHFCVDVTDIEQEFIRLRELGMTFSQPGPIDVGHVKTIYGRDPEGNLIEIQQTIEGKCDFPLAGLTKEPTRR